MNFISSGSRCAHLMSQLIDTAFGIVYHASSHIVALAFGRITEGRCNEVCLMNTISRLPLSLSLSERGHIFQPVTLWLTSTIEGNISIIIIAAMRTRHVSKKGDGMECSQSAYMFWGIYQLSRLCLAKDVILWSSQL